MVDFCPFSGLRYNPRVVEDLSRVLCPPYDQITQETQGELYGLSPYNAVRLEAGERLPTDTPENNRNTRTAATFQAWIGEGALVREEGLAFYLVRQHLTFRGCSSSLVGLIGVLRLEEYEKRVVLPHEHTSEAIKRDRLALMEACPANFSPIMCLYKDEEALESLYREIMSTPPSITISDFTGQRQEVWVISQHELVHWIVNLLTPKELYIADGHHRYETALMYRDLLRSRSTGPWTGEEPANFIMAFLCHINHPGLMVLPYHRLIGGLTAEAMGRVRDRLREVFDIQPVAGASDSALDKLLRKVEKEEVGKDVLGLVGLEGQRPYMLTLRQEARPPEKGPISSIESWLLEELVLRPALGDELHEHLTWIHGGRQAVEKLKNGSHQMAFLLKPLSMELFQTIVGLGQRLPPKSTYFYPKLPTGLTINKLSSAD